ncbi:GNAT family N-acetyltransferase [Phenylobacterium sp.]|uniref:GNAT family N-acetyltransferase n=1 Tax=Phenylobacterium sp. TaxID=1871053 RepID=UPI00262EA18D|nr:GNAT family N-acetyltransferase [Phenylobacterium sp.]
MSQPVIRRASPSDAPTLATIAADTFVETFGHLYPPQDLRAFLADAYDAERLRAELADPTGAVWLAEADGETIGYAQVGPCGLPHPEVTALCGELKRLYFRKAWQNRGLGQRLFAEAMAWLQRAGPRDVWIGVWSENFGAQRFYGRQGFEKAGEYGFRVGRTVDHEFILRRRAESFLQATQAARSEVQRA